MAVYGMRLGDDITVCMACLLVVNRRARARGRWKDAADG